MQRDDEGAAADRLRSTAEYKTILHRVLESRPSGTRQRLATALAKNRSFVTQIASPAYDTPIPAKHVDVILEICHFSAAEREAFLQAYRRCHPGRREATSDARRLRAHIIYLPDLGTVNRNREIDQLVGDFVQGLADLMVQAARPSAARKRKNAS